MLKTVYNFNRINVYVSSTVRVSVEEYCVLCEVRTFCQQIICVIVKFQVEPEEIFERTVFPVT